MMIVVFDSNVWISAFRFGGGPMQALEAAYRTHTVAFCNEIEAEVERTMLPKFGLSRYHTARLMNRWVDEGIRIKITGTLKTPVAIAATMSLLSAPFSLRPT